MNSNRGSVRRFPTEDVGRQIASTAAYVVLSLVFIKRGDGGKINARLWCFMVERIKSCNVNNLQVQVQKLILSRIL